MSATAGRRTATEIALHDERVRAIRNIRRRPDATASELLLEGEPPYILAKLFDDTHWEVVRL